MSQSYDAYLETRKAILELLDNAVLSNTLRPDEIQQMLDALEMRFTGWADGRVPEDIRDDLISRWHNGEGGGMPLHEFLCITPTQYKRWLESEVQKDIREARLRKEQDSCQRK